MDRASYNGPLRRAAAGLLLCLCAQREHALAVAAEGAAKALCAFLTRGLADDHNVVAAATALRALTLGCAANPAAAIARVPAPMPRAAASLAEVERLPEGADTVAVESLLLAQRGHSMNAEVQVAVCHALTAYAVAVPGAASNIVRKGAVESIVIYGIRPNPADAAVQQARLPATPAS